MAAMLWLSLLPHEADGRKHVNKKKRSRASVPRLQSVTWDEWSEASSSSGGGGGGGGGGSAVGGEGQVRRSVQLLCCHLSV
eukprot:COSAG02_NODE_39977_length_410_cov_1.189711_1_plen_81_part_00